ncbi:MAG TPA: glycine cleavage system aminomethyltransferase GcvT [Stellaceae bacterium]|jgi:aminomethyltransferase|nr:glycine cleavage system aminomethyltransferase GcvT [Stellaceae bacterium]
MVLSTDSDQPTDLRRTPLHALHVARGAKMVPFAGYEMPVQYPTGIIAEHLHTRTQAGLFDVSHMGQVLLHGVTAGALEALVPGDIEALPDARMRYTLLLNDDGGIIDDLMAIRFAGGLRLVVNAATKDGDVAHLRAGLGAGSRVELLDDRALLALQGPHAAAVLARLAPGVETMPFLSCALVERPGMTLFVTRSGYTGEDGFEISVAAERAVELAELLLAQREVLPIGLGARDTLRLEAGLCLYGHDIDETTTPIAAGLAWTIAKRRREEGGFPGALRILKELADPPARRRVGIRPDGRAPAREGSAIVDPAGNLIGEVTSGGFGPSLNAPIAMGYVARSYSDPGTALAVVVRDVARLARVSPLPFVPTRYYRGH